MSLLSRLLDRLSDTELKPLRYEEFPTAEEVESCNALANWSDPEDVQQLESEMENRAVWDGCDVP